MVLVIVVIPMVIVVVIIIIIIVAAIMIIIRRRRRILIAIKAAGPSSTPQAGLAGRSSCVRSVQVKAYSIMDHNIT